MTWIVHVQNEAVKQLRAIIFKPIHGKRAVEVLAILLRNEATYK